MKPSDDRTTPGILRADEGRGRYELTRYEPALELKLYIQHYWRVDWDLRGREPFRQPVLSHPNVNLVFEPGNTRIYGIWEKTATQTLEGLGSVFAIKFNPGGFYPFWRKPLSLLTRGTADVAEVFGAEAVALESDILAAGVEEQVERIDRFLLARLPEPDRNVELVNGLVAELVADRAIVQVEQLAERFGIGVRTLQRLFDKYVGVSPKGVIQRFRMHEIAGRIDKGEALDWSALSLDMGYYDQAHFIKDFKAVLGATPDEYARRSSRPGEAR